MTDYAAPPFEIAGVPQDDPLRAFSPNEIKQLFIIATEHDLPSKDTLGSLYVMYGGIHV